MSELHFIEIDRIYPHPDNPRKEVGDVTELAESIKANGILQNLTLVPYGQDVYDGEWKDEYRVIIGHRRLAAAKKAGLNVVPCVVRDMTPQEQVKTMLLENMQRSDLTVYEQAQGFQMMLDMGETVESIAKDSGFSQTTVRRRVKLLDLDADKFRKSEARGATLQDYMELDKIDDPELKNKALDAIGTANFRNELKSAIEADKLKKRMAAWRADLESFATEIEKRDYIGEEHVPMDYVRNYSRWSGDVTVERPADADTVSYYFRVSEEQIDLYKDRLENAEAAETEENRKIKEEKAAFDRKVEELEEITERHFSLRSEFICDFTAAKKHLSSICEFAVRKIFDQSSVYRHRHLDHELIAELLDLNIEDSTDFDTLCAMCENSAGTSPEFTLLAVAYATDDHDKNGFWRREWSADERKWVLCYKPNDNLDRLYSFLSSLGYEMSDEEKAMQNGNHELFCTEGA